MSIEPSLLIGLLTTVLLVGIALGGKVVNDYWKWDAIENGKAQHNPTTGKVEWK